MHELILWCGFFGSWLLVAGPLHQASRELAEENISPADMLNVPRPEPTRPRPSGWWWLIPPVGFWKQRRYAKEQGDLTMASIPTEMIESWVSFTNKATAWFYVAAGAFLIAIKETGDLVDGHEWPAWVFWVLCLLMAAVTAANTAVRRIRSRSAQLVNR